MKVCSKCGLEKDLCCFYFRRNRQQWDSYCRECTNTQNKLYARIHPDIVKAKRDKHRQSLKGRYTAYKSDAKRRNLVFDITISQFNELTKQACRYCGQFNLGHTFCGVDRVNNKFGYMIDNCIPCCHTCNILKTDMSHEAFISHISRIYNYTTPGTWVSVGAQT